MINLAKFRDEIDGWVDFLGLGINGCSRNLKNPKADEQAIEKGKFVKEIDAPGVFLGLGIDSSSNYEINHGNPTPLRSYHPTQGYKDCSSSSSSDPPLLLLLAPPASSSTCCGGKKRMLGEQKKKVGPKSKRSRLADEYPEPIDPPQELVQVIGPNVRPVYLYRKQLSEWDTREDQNRLFVNDRKKLMDFMTEEERLAVEDPEKHGIDILGFDSLGGKYEMHSNKWASLDKVVVNKGWFTILDTNKAKKGDWVHLWAFRSDRGEFCLYVDFRHQP